MSNPRVSAILKAVGLMEDYRFVTDERYAARGRALHQAIQWHAEGTLAEASIHPDIRPGFDAYLAFVAKYRHRPEASELELDHPKYGYQGHLDRAGTVNDDMAIIDWKYSDSVDVRGAELQLAAYDLLWHACQAGTPATRCYVVGLQKNGKPKVIDVTNDHAKQVFLAALMVYRARQEMGR